MLGTDRDPVTADEAAAGLDRPLRVFPLFENALRAGSGQTIDEHQRQVSELWARFSSVAASNPYAWSREPRTAHEIRTPGPSNRMVSFPYPKLMNANDRVDQGAAFILCSVARRSRGGRARGPLGLSRWQVQTRTTTGSSRNDKISVSSPAIGLAGHRALSLAGVGIDDVAHIDLYSCFPCAVQIAAAALGLALDDPGRSLTVTGGLGFAGGPGNNYVSHSIATMAGRLRADPGALGLVTGLGWYSTKHAVGRVVDDSPGRGVPSRVPTGRGRRAAPAGAGRRTTRATPPSRPTPWSTTGKGSPSSPILALSSPVTEPGPGGTSPDRDDMVGLTEREGADARCGWRRGDEQSFDELSDVVDATQVDTGRQ